MIDMSTICQSTIWQVYDMAIYQMTWHGFEIAIPRYPEIEQINIQSRFTSPIYSLSSSVIWYAVTVWSLQHLDNSDNFCTTTGASRSVRILTDVVHKLVGTLNAELCMSTVEQKCIFWMFLADDACVVLLFWRNIVLNLKANGNSLFSTSWEWKSL